MALLAASRGRTIQSACTVSVFVVLLTVTRVSRYQFVVSRGTAANDGAGAPVRARVLLELVQEDGRMVLGAGYESRQLTIGMHVVRGFGGDAEDEDHIPTSLPRTPQLYYAKKFSRSVEVRVRVAPAMLIAVHVRTVANRYRLSVVATW